MKLTKIEGGAPGMVKEAPDNLVIEKIRFGAVIDGKKGPIMAIEMMTEDGETFTAQFDVIGVNSLINRADGFMQALKNSLLDSNPEMQALFDKMKEVIPADLMKDIADGKVGMEVISGSAKEVISQLKEMKEKIGGLCQCDNCKAKRGEKLDKHYNIVGDPGSVN